MQLKKDKWTDRNLGAAAFIDSSAKGDRELIKVGRKKGWKWALGCHSFVDKVKRHESLCLCYRQDGRQWEERGGG